jgi:hypothetical protein
MSTNTNGSDFNLDPTSPGSELIWRGEIVKQLFGDVGELTTGYQLCLNHYNF